MLEIKGDELFRARDLALGRMAGLLAAQPLVTGGPDGGRRLAESFESERRSRLAAMVIVGEAVEIALQERAAVLALVAAPDEQTDAAVLDAMVEIRNTLDGQSSRNRFNGVDGLEAVERQLDAPATQDLFAALGQSVIMGAEGDYTPTSPLGPGREMAIIMDTATLRDVSQHIQNQLS